MMGLTRLTAISGLKLTSRAQYIDLLDLNEQSHSCFMMISPRTLAFVALVLIAFIPNFLCDITSPQSSGLDIPLNDTNQANNSDSGVDQQTE